LGYRIAHDVSLFSFIFYFKDFIYANGRVYKEPYILGNKLNGRKEEKWYQ